MSAPSPKFAVLRREGRPTEFRSAEAAERVTDRIEDSGDAGSASSSVGTADRADDATERAPRLLVAKAVEPERLLGGDSGEIAQHDGQPSSMAAGSMAAGWRAGRAQAKTCPPSEAAAACHDIECSAARSCGRSRPAERVRVAPKKENAP